MEINIHQKKLSIGDEYQIFTEGKLSHYASSKPFSWQTEINLFEQGGGRSKYSIRSKWTFFNISFNLTRWDNNILEFRTRNSWKEHYYCHSEGNLYEIFGHQGRKYSVYRNGTQIAWWDKERVSWFNGDNYTIIADKDCDHALIISFCLIIDNSYSNDNDTSVFTIDLGRIGFVSRKFDPNWQPKS